MQLQQHSQQQIARMAEPVCPVVPSPANLLPSEQQKNPPGGNTYLPRTPTESDGVACDFKVLILIPPLPAATKNSLLSSVRVNKNVIFGKAQISEMRLFLEDVYFFNSL